MPIIQTDKPLRERHKEDFYPTPFDLCLATTKYVFSDLKYFRWRNRFPVSGPLKVCDPGAGTGVWGGALWKYATWQSHPMFRVHLTGVENSEDRAALYYYDKWVRENYLDHYGQYDLIIGNPPYREAEEFVRHSRSLLNHNGKMVFLLRLAFLESQKRATGLWEEYKPERVVVLGRRPSFTGDGKTDATAYAIYIFGKKPAKRTELSWLMWDYENLS